MSRLDGVDLGVMSAEGQRVKARREHLGMGIRDLADAAEVSRDTLSDLESGAKDYRQATLGKVLRALDRLEDEMGVHAPPRAGQRDLGDDFVEFTVEGNFGVRAVVKGPIRDIDALQAAVAKLVAGMQAETSVQKGDDLDGM